MGHAGYDIVAVDSGRILVVEVKKKTERHLVDEFLKDKLPKFRQVFPEYRDFQVIVRARTIFSPIDTYIIILYYIPYKLYSTIFIDNFYKKYTKV